MHEQNLSEYGIECSIGKRQINDDEKFLKAFIPYVIHDSELDGLYNDINNFSFNVGYGNIHKNAILGFKYHDAMFFTANLPENRSLLTFVGFKEDINIVLPYKALDFKDPTVYMGNSSNKMSNFRFVYGIREITMFYTFANSPHYTDKDALGKDFWRRKQLLDRALQKQSIADSNAMIEYYKGRSL